MMLNAQTLPNIGTGVFAKSSSGGRFKVEIAGTAALPNKFHELYRALHTETINDVQFVSNTIRSNRGDFLTQGGANNGAMGVYMMQAKHNVCCFTDLKRVLLHRYGYCFCNR